MRGIGWLLLGAAGAAGTAEAGPWAQEPGSIYARGIVSTERLDGEDGRRGEIYGEYGLARNWSVTAKAEMVRYEGGGISDRDALRVSARRQLWSSDKGWALGAEAGLVYGSAVAGVFGCDGLGGEARMSVGRSGTVKGRNYFVFADVADIRHEDGCARQRAEFGYGSDIGPHLFTLQQVWLERGNQSADSIKFDSQIGYHFKSADLSLGYREESGGAYREHAVLVAVTLRR